ncbi:MAG: tetratricopeptide repeat protein, partial [Nannocystaceae bacterium]
MLKLVLIFATQILAAAPASEDAAAYKSAKQHFNEGRYQEAANRFEELWERSPKPKYLHYAAMAWAALGRDTHAILDWQRVLSTPEIDEKLRASVDEFLVEAYKRAPVVTVKIAADNAPAEAWAVTLTPAHGPPITGTLAEFQKPGSSE